MSAVENLLNLFRVDGQVRALRGRLSQAERYLAGQLRQFGDLQAQQQELQTRRKHLQASIANFDVEVKAIDERIEKYRNDLNSATTNKQYSAVLSELNTVKANRAEIEERMLADMEQLERLQESFAEVEQKLVERARLRDLAQAQLAEREADVGQRLAELERERSEAAAVVSPDALAVFDELADSYEGEAMAAVEEIDRRGRDYACGSCNMHIPFEQVSMLTSRVDALVRCTSCSRILYLKDEMRGSLAKK